MESRRSPGKDSEEDYLKEVEEILKESNNIFPEIKHNDDDEIDNIEDLIKYLEDEAESYPYIDPDFDILILDCSNKPIIILSPQEFKKLEKKIIGG